MPQIIYLSSYYFLVVIIFVLDTTSYWFVSTINKTQELVLKMTGSDTERDTMRCYATSRRRLDKEKMRLLGGGLDLNFDL